MRVAGNKHVLRQAFDILNPLGVAGLVAGSRKCIILVLSADVTCSEGCMLHTCVRVRLLICVRSYVICDMWDVVCVVCGVW